MIKEELARLLSGIRELNDLESIYKMLDSVKESLMIEDIVKEENVFKNPFDKTLYISGRLFYFTLGAMISFIIFSIIFKI